MPNPSTGQSGGWHINQGGINSVFYNFIEDFFLNSKNISYRVIGVENIFNRLKWLNGLQKNSNR